LAELKQYKIANWAIKCKCPTERVEHWVRIIAVR